jgi:hypothetical protein
MAGTSTLVCSGFIETTFFTSSKEDLKVHSGLTDRQIDDRMEGVVWALHQDADQTAHKVPDRNLWLVPIPEGDPPLILYIRQSKDDPQIAEWMWIQERYA